MANYQASEVAGNIEVTGRWLGEGTVETGAMLPFVRDNAPDGWLECNGAAVDRTTYSDLFEAIGTTFGSGDGSTTFNVPDLRGEFIRGWDNGRGVDSGRSFGSSQSDLIVNHTHSGTTNTEGAHNHRQQLGEIDDKNWTGGTSNTNNGQLPPSDGPLTNRRYTIDSTNSDHNHDFTTNGPNVNSGSETRPRNVAVLYCIKV